MRGEDLGCKPDVIQKANFEYFPLGKVFSKGLEESNKKEGLLKRLKNIEGKNEEQLKAIEDQGEKQLKAINEQRNKFITLKSIYKSEINDDSLTKECQKVFKKLEKIESSIDYGSLYYLGGDRKREFNVNVYGTLAIVYLKLINGKIGLLDMNVTLMKFKDELEELKRKKNE